MNEFQIIPKPTKRYIVIEYPAEIEDSIKESVHEFSNVYFDSSSLETTIASAYTYLRKLPAIVEDNQRICASCENYVANPYDRFCCEDCAEAAHFNNLEAEATGN